MEFLKLCGITFILVMALKIVMSEGMLLERLGAFFERKVGEGKKVYDLFICPFCMATLGSLVAHGFAMGLGVIPFEWSWHLLIRWPLVVMFCSFLCGMTWTAYETLNKIKDKNEAEMHYYLNLVYN